jgi:hypothetical protein
MAYLDWVSDYADEQTVMHAEPVQVISQAASGWRGHWLRGGGGR